MSYVLSALPTVRVVMSHANGHADSDHVHPLTVNKSLKDIIVGVGGDIKKAHVALTAGPSMQF